MQFPYHSIDELYYFKAKVFQLCVEYITSTAINSVDNNNMNNKSMERKLTHIESSLYDLFSRWIYIAIECSSFDFDLCLPNSNSEFIQQSDIQYLVDSLLTTNSNAITTAISRISSFPMQSYYNLLLTAQDKIFNYIANRSDSKDRDQEVVFDNYDISPTQYQRLKSLYKGNNFHLDLSKLYARYEYIGGNSVHLSVPPCVIHALSLRAAMGDIHALVQGTLVLKQSPSPTLTAVRGDTYDKHDNYTVVELFGTPLNTCSNSYCSPFPDEIGLFSSQGSFFNFHMYTASTVYLANPPFDDCICTKMTMKILHDIEYYDTLNICYIVILPVWDSVQQQLHNLPDYNMSFTAYNLLLNSPYFKLEMYLPKYEYPFYDYKNDRYVYVSHTHIIQLGNYSGDLSGILSEWRNIQGM